MTVSRTRIALPLLVGGMIALWTGLFVEPVWAVNQNVTVQIQPGAEGAGFGVVLWGATSNLTVTLTTAGSNLTIVQPTTIRSSGDFIWNWTAITNTSETANALGIGRDDDHSVGFNGAFATTGGTGSGTGSNIFDVAVADVRFAGHATNQTDATAIYIPASDSGVPLDAGTINVTVTLQASSTAPDPAGTLTFTWTDPGIDHLTYNGSQINSGQSIPVPKAGLPNAPIEVFTTEFFIQPATIQATYNWQSSFVAQSATAVTATDWVSVAPATYAVYVIDAQAFTPTMTPPGISGDPTSAVDGTYLRNAVFTDGASVLVIRIPGQQALADNLTFSIRHLANPNFYPANTTQTTAYIGSLSATFPATFPAPDTGAGSPSVFIPQNTAKVVYYCPPNNFLFGLQGGQATEIDVYSGGQQVGLASLGLIRPTIILNHGVLSDPSVMQPLGGVLVAQSGSQAYLGRRYARVLYLDWHDINIAGYDNVSGRVPAKIASELVSNRTVGIAATRVDFVGHSMGGVIVKWYASDLGVQVTARRNFFPWLNWNGPNYQCHRDNNFGAGDVRRLVSVGSPFQGSPIADAVSNLGINQYRRNLGQILGWPVPAPLNIDIDAGDDLGATSKATFILSGAQPKPKVSWLPIVGYGTPMTEQNFLGKGGFDLLSVLGCLPSQISPLLGPGGTTSDFVVDQWSQADRPPNTPIAAMPATWGVNNVFHTSEMTNGLAQVVMPDGSLVWQYDPTVQQATVFGGVAYALDLWYNTPQDPGYQAGYQLCNPSF